MRRFKWWVRGLGQKALPKFTLAVLANRTWVLEPEVALVPLMSRRKGLAIDAGANKGVYLYHLARHYRRVAGFEPLPSLASYLKAAAPKNATVHNIALSNVTGVATLSLPQGFNELGSLEAHTSEAWTTSAAVERHQVETHPLDSFGFEDVSFLKIDVEGHEMAVLQGAENTLKRWRPPVLVEVEERHAIGGVRRLRDYMENLGYRGYYVDGATLKPIATFDAERDQNLESLRQSVKVGRYINKSCSSIAPMRRSASTSLARPSNTRSRSISGGFGAKPVHNRARTPWRAAQGHARHADRVTATG